MKSTLASRCRRRKMFRREETKVHYTPPAWLRLSVVVVFLPILLMLEANKSVFHSHSFLLFSVAICCCCSWNQTQVYLTPPAWLRLLVVVVVVVC